MDRGGKEQRRRDRLRDYEAQLEGARQAVAVLAEFARARESRAVDRPLEAEFAVTAVEGYAEPLPAGVWVALRRGDLDAVVDILVQGATEQFLIAEHEELGSGYRLTAVPESRGVPDLDRLIAQVAAFLGVPNDVLAVIAGWGPEDPRTIAEIEHLLDPRHGPPSPATGARPASRPAPLPPPTNAPADPRTRLTLSRAEFAAVLALTPNQRDVFAALTREADILIRADRGASTAPGSTADA